MKYTIQQAVADHAPLLAAIEIAAAGIFPPGSIPDHIRSDSTPIGMLLEAIQDGLLWVALAGDGKPVGYALVRLIEDAALLAQMDVHPDHMRRGVGSALIGQVVEHLRSRKKTTLYLTTFTHVPWNAPLFTLGGSKYLAEEGDIALIAPGCGHSCNPVDSPRGYYMLLIDAAWLRERMGEEFLFCPPLIKDASLSSIAGAVMDAILADQENAADMLAELLLELRARYSRADKGGEMHPRQWLELNDTNDAVRANGAPLSVAALARAAGMRRESFSRAVRRTTGLPPLRHLQCLQLEKARSLLRQGKSILEAALGAGYTDQSHFHRRFLKFCAVTPGRFRRGMSQSYKK